MLARKYPTLLVDMDLTGTSLADVFPLRAPRLAERGMKLVLEDRPTAGFLSLAESRTGMERRAQEQDPVAKHVPFLNDDFLFEQNRFDASRDTCPGALSWQLDTQDETIRNNLRVVPSSALPNDLCRILPIIYDESYAGFLEARLEWFLARTIEQSPVRHVVFDSPPTIPGLSAALLSLSMRLPERIGLTREGWNDTPSALREARTHWVPVLVTTPDLQDLRAADRWLRDLNAKEQARVLVAVNRSRSDDPAAVAHALRSRLAEATNIAFGLDFSKGPLAPEVFSYDGVMVREDRVPNRLVAVPDSEALQMFQADVRDTPSDTEGIEQILSQLDASSNATPI